MANRTYATVYSSSFLPILYDKYVLGFNMRFVWGCPTGSVLFPFFAENFSRNHLDCGVATGWFPATALARPWRAQSKQHLSLLDLNPSPLALSKTRVLSVTTATEIRCIEADATDPLPESLKGAKFDSISMFNLFHCMPGGNAKLEAFDTFKDLLAGDGVLSGCTVLGGDHAANWATKLYLRWYNWWGVFNNWDDKRDAFEEALAQAFEEYETWVIGTTLLFRATKPRRRAGPLVDVDVQDGP